MGFPGGSDGKESICLQCRRSRFDPWVGKILWGRAWHPTSVLLARESHGQRSLAGYSPWVTVGQAGETSPFTLFPFTEGNRRLFSSPKASLIPTPQPSSFSSPCRTTPPPASVSAPLQTLDSSCPWSGRTWGIPFSSVGSEHEAHPGSVPTAVTVRQEGDRRARACHDHADPGESTL